MNKTEFTEKIISLLADYPRDKVMEQLEFYLEAIDDRKEDGMTEEEAVEALGSIERIAEEIKIGLPLTSLAGSAIKKSRSSAGNKTLWAVLAALGSPLWLVLVLCALILLLSVYVVIWSVAVALWAAEASLALGGIAGVIHGIVRIFGGQIGGGMMVSGAYAFAAGLSILLFTPFCKATKGLAAVSVMIPKKIKSALFGSGKGEVK